VVVIPAIRELNESVITIAFHVFAAMEEIGGPVLCPKLIKVLWPTPLPQKMPPAFVGNVMKNMSGRWNGLLCLPPKEPSTSLDMVGELNLKMNFLSL
tara:strand:- start:207 stop:497 length:291 start_codon:yes stop_codon:yes gene_type:complete